MEKTNVLKMLDKKKIPYESYTYDNSKALSGVEVAEILGKDQNAVFKTLVTKGKSGKNYVFVVPAPSELDLKKAAKAVSEKSIEMIKLTELLPLTGYVHGGCSPIGMKKSFPTVIDCSVNQLETFIFSAGKIGIQVELSLENLKKMIPFELASLCVEL